MAHTTGAREAVTATDPVLIAVRVTSALTAAALLFQFLTAGSLIGAGGQSVEGLHATGAIVLHVVSGLAMVAAFAFWRVRGAALWPAVVSLLVFALTFVQATAGSSGDMAVHVPGAMVLTVGTVVVATWAFLRAGATG